MGMLFSTSIRLVVSSSSSRGAPPSEMPTTTAVTLSLPPALVGQRDELRRKLAERDVRDDLRQLLVGT
jgi:hypothetical protein